MSSRNFRKVSGNAGLPPAEDEPDEGYEPLYAQNASKASMYKELQLSSGSERESPVASEAEEAAATVQKVPKKKKPKKKRGKGKAPKATAYQELDEIDKSVIEVNALLGEPPASSTSTNKPNTNQLPDVMKVSRIHLNANVEMKRFFGPTGDGNNRRSRNDTFSLLKRVLILPLNETTIYDFKNKNGVSMSINRTENDMIYFTFDHTPERQKMHYNYLRMPRQRDAAAVMLLDEMRERMHVEGLLELCEVLFRIEEYSLASEIIENLVAFLQYCGHPSFNVAKENVRLEFKYWENRPFHVAILKYIYLLTNKVCHRTALELAKMLLNLDPSDPLAVLFVVDILALRAREYEWLIEAIDHFVTLREAGHLFNFQYSHALAEFQIATKKKRDTNEADILLQEAIISYPTVVTKIFECANIQNSTITSCGLFASEPFTFATDGLNALMFIYAKLTHGRFREPAVLEWFLRNVKAMVEKYNNNEDVKIRAKEMIDLRHNLFGVWPAEVLRHLGVIKNMSTFIFGERLPKYDRRTCGWDPLQDGGINRYHYPSMFLPPANLGPPGSSLYRFFSSMLPSYDDQQPPVDD